MTLTIKVGIDEKSKPCVCCGNIGSTDHGFVYRDGDALAVYYAAWSEAHAERGISLAIAIGEWEDNTSESDRACIGLEAYQTENDILFRFIEPSESQWPNTHLLGPMLTRNEALAHPQKNEFLSVAELVVREHPAIKEFLGPVLASESPY